MEFLTSVSSQRNEAIEQLQEVKSVYLTLVSDECVKEHMAYEFLMRVYQLVTAALKWANSIERKVMLEVTHQTGIWDRIKEYQTEAEAKVTLLLQVSEPEYSKIKEQLNHIMDKIQHEIQVSQRAQDLEAVQTLESLLSYIRSSTNYSTDNSIPTRIKRAEADLFKLVDSINKLTLENKEEEFLTLKKNLNTLTKEISSLRSTLEKKISTGENVEENKVRVDHLEDLQENLSDLTYTYSNKFDAYSRFLEKTLPGTGSKKKNNREVDSIYEL